MDTTKQQEVKPTKKTVKKSIKKKPGDRSTKKKDGTPKVYDKKPNGKNATGRPNVWNTPEELEVLIDKYFNSISLTTPRFVTKVLPLKEETTFEVIETFYKMEPDLQAEEDEDGNPPTKRVRYKKVNVPVLNNN